MNSKKIILSAIVILVGLALYLIWRGAQQPENTKAPPNMGFSNSMGPGLKVERGAVEAEAMVNAVAAKGLPDRLATVEKWASEAESSPSQSPHAQALACFVGLLKVEKHPDVRLKAVQAVGRQWRGDPVAVIALTRCLKATEKAPVQEAAGEALRDLEEAGQGAVPSLIELLAEDEYRLPALAALAEIGPFAGSAVEPVGALLKSNRVTERRAALHVLRRIGSASAGVLGDKEGGIVACLGDRDPRARAEAAWVLKRIGEPAKRADIKAALKGLQGDQEEEVRHAADAAWKKLFSPEKQ